MVRYGQAMLTASGAGQSVIEHPHLLNPAQSIPVTVPGLTSLTDTAWMLHTAWLSRDQVATLDLTQAGPWQAYFDADSLQLPLILRSRQPGDYFAPYGLRGQRQRLSDFMIDRKIDVDIRAHIPVLASESGHIYWLCGWRTDHHSRIRSDTKRVLWAGFEEG